MITNNRKKSRKKVLRGTLAGRITWMALNGGRCFWYWIVSGPFDILIVLCGCAFLLREAYGYHPAPSLQRMGTSAQLYAWKHLETCPLIFPLGVHVEFVGESETNYLCSAMGGEGLPYLFIASRDCMRQLSPTCLADGNEITCHSLAVIH